MSGRSFLQIPGPTNIPDRVLRAMDRPVVDHRSPEFAQLTEDVRVGLRAVFGTRDGAADALPGLGHGRHGSGAGQRARARAIACWSYNYGLFSGGMGNIARKFGFEVDEVDAALGPGGLGRTTSSGDFEPTARAIRIGRC